MSNHQDSLSPQAEQALVRQLAQQVVELRAPEELAVFDETAEEYFADPEGVLRAESREEAVGFGVELVLLTPYILAVVTPVIQLLASMVGEAVKNERQSSVNALVRRLLGRHDVDSPPDAPEPEALSRAQLDRVRSVALERGRVIGLPDDKAALLADAIAGGIAVTATD